MRRYDDPEVQRVAETLGDARPLTMAVLIRELDRLFNRMTFRYERTWQCRTQNWDQRLHAAMQTWQMLEDHRSFVQAHGSRHYAAYAALVREVYRYCDYMASSLFKPPPNWSALQTAIGHDEEFHRQLPEKVHFTDLEAAARDLTFVDEPRALAIEQMNALVKEFAPGKFDVLLSYHHRDEAIVRELKTQLEAVPLRVWLDHDELRPGLRWQDQLAQAIVNSSSAVVAIGADGDGDWQREEVQTFLNRSVKEQIPVIPVLLPGAPDASTLGFLQNCTWVDLRQGITAHGIATIAWGITGIKPGGR